MRCLRKDPERRFQNMADVKVALAELRDESDSATQTAPQAGLALRIKRRRLAILLILPLVIAVAWVLWRRIGGEVQSPVVTQLTTYAGSEGSPSFSPDGSQVAFAWNGEKEDNSDIYVKIVGEANALRLTTNPGADARPAWSPDGRRIAFMRFAPGDAGGIYLISPLGGAEQKLVNFVGAGQMSWSPDGKFLAIDRGSTSRQETGPAIGATRASALVLLPLGGGEPRPISTPPAPGWDWCPAFSPDGRQLAYARCSGSSMCDLYIQELGPDCAPRGDRRRITRQEMFINGLAWSPDGKSLIFGASVGHGVVTYLWRVDAKGTSPPARIELAGRRVAEPAIAPAGNRMAFARRQGNQDIWRYTLGGVAEPFLTSSLIEWHPRFSTDGKKVVFSSDRGGETFEIWVANADGSNPVPVTDRVGRYVGSPDWSPDGRWIAFDCQTKEGNWNIWVVETSGAGLRRVTSGPSDEHIPTWSRDGRSIYFDSNRTGRYEIWRVAFAGGQPEQITANGGHTAFESFDGKTLYYTKDTQAAPSPIFEMRLAGKQERQVVDHVSFRAFAVVEDGIYYIGRREDDRRYPLRFHPFSASRDREITRLENVSNYSLTVSPDRKGFLFTKSVTTGTDLMLVENFR
jgi:Tol biopolymer transport system component